MTEHGLYDQACLNAESQAKRMKFLYEEKTYARIGGERAIKDLVKVSGLSENLFLYGCYQEQFSKISTQDYMFPEEKFRSLTALWGLHTGRFYHMNLPVSETIREHVAAPGHENLPPKTYNFGDLKAFETYSLDFSRWDEKFDGYITDVRKLKNGKSDNLPDEKYQMRFNLAGEILKKLKARLTELLKPGDTVKVVKNNVVLRQLVSEISRWPDGLKSFIWNRFDELKKELKVKDKFAELVLNGLSDAVYEGLDFEAFRCEIITYYWGQLDALLKESEQKEIVGIIKLEVEELTNN
jgi:hypothetical protein